MRDWDRVIERAFEVADQLRAQIARVAFALEYGLVMDMPNRVGEISKTPCRECGTLLVPVTAAVCPACGAMRRPGDA